MQDKKSEINRPIISRYLTPLLLIGACAAAPLVSHATRSIPAKTVTTITDESELPHACPEEAGVDSRQLVRLSEWIRKERLDIRSLLVIKDGKLIFERYSKGLTRNHNYELYSITKGVTALAAGKLINDGRLSLDDKVSTSIAQFRPDLKDSMANKKAIALRHLLSMSSGLFYDFKPKDDPIYYGAPDRLKLAANTMPKIAAGKEFEYTDVNPIFVAAMTSSAAAMPVEQYATEKLFKPLAMKNYVWDRADGMGLVSAGWGLRLRPVDMGKIGMLMMDGGKWQGKQLVPEDWIKQMATPVAARDFGYFLWINHIVETEPEFDMMGFKGQFISVLPHRNTVVVMTSMLPVDGGLRNAKNVRIFRDIVNDYVLPAIDNKDRTTPSEPAKIALMKELALSAQSQGKPGVAAEPTDTPRDGMASIANTTAN
ncbi:MAG: hypothetical protein NVSMB28_08410 [Collimonas sp.]